MIARWAHLLFGITWLGLLYYFNFVQGGYFKTASKEGLRGVEAKLAPKALWWFRWGAMLTFLAGVYLLWEVGALFNDYIVLGALMGTFMFLNVWLVIWPAQQIAIGMKKGDGAEAGAKAMLASQTNLLFSVPMAYCMFSSAHKGYAPEHLLSGFNASGVDTGLFIALAIIVLLELNAVFGKHGPLKTIKGAIHMSMLLTASLIMSLVYI